jgi:hypothetical protein
MHPVHPAPRSSKDKAPNNPVIIIIKKKVPPAPDAAFFKICLCWTVEQSASVITWLS